jgi:hypothetical protein
MLVFVHAARTASASVFIHCATAMCRMFVGATSVAQLIIRVLVLLCQWRQMQG